MELTTKSSFIVFILLHLHVNVNGECPTGWLHFGDSCFYFSNINLDWFTAEISCQSHNARLAEIDSKGQSDFLITTATRLGGPGYWLGGQDSVVEGSWTWVSTDNPFTYTAWVPGQPNGTSNENCVHICASQNWLWNDAPCTFPNYRYICEKKDQLEATTVTLPRPTSPNVHGKPAVPDFLG